MRTPNAGCAAMASPIPMPPHHRPRVTNTRSTRITAKRTRLVCPRPRTLRVGSRRSVNAMAAVHPHRLLTLRRAVTSAKHSLTHRRTASSEIPVVRTTATGTDQAVTGMKKTAASGARSNGAPASRPLYSGWPSSQPCTASWYARRSSCPYQYAVATTVTVQARAKAPAAMPTVRIRAAAEVDMCCSLWGRAGTITDCVEPQGY